MQLGEVYFEGITELMYEYGTKWNVKVIVMSEHPPEKGKAMCFIAGAGAAPSETVDGPLRFRRLLSILENSNDTEKQAAQSELGHDFVPGLFDMKKCNKELSKT